MWRTIYLSKLPRFEKKLRVALDWTLDLLFTKDLVQFQTFRASTISHMGDTEMMAASPPSDPVAAPLEAGS
jgi:NADH dehydrogenase